MKLPIKSGTELAWVWIIIAIELKKARQFLEYAYLILKEEK